MVHLWYPADADPGVKAGVYLPGARAIEGGEHGGRLRQSPNWSRILTGSLTSHVRDGAPIARNPQRFPLVIFSHGDGISSFEYTAAIEDLVSHGYIVAAVEHPFSSAAVLFPDGRLIEFGDRRTLRGDRPANTPYFAGVQMAMSDLRRVTEIHAADLRFVLDRLRLFQRGDQSARMFTGRFDLRHVAAVGHSAGGFAAVRACQLDIRVRACVNIDGGSADGAFLQYPGAPALEQPFLYVEATPPLTLTEQQLAERGITRDEWTRYARNVRASQERQLRSGRGDSYKAELRAPDMGHMSVADVLLAAPNPAARKRARHNLQLTMTVTRAFLDQYLKGARGSVLDAAAGSEVIVLRWRAER